jgi:uncharacterized protein YkwD
MMVARSLYLILFSFMTAHGAQAERKPVPFALVNQPAETNCTIADRTAQEVCLGLNRIRAQNRVGALKSDRHLTQVAMDYARKMYESQTLTHGNFSDRMVHAGIGWPAAENIAQGQKTAGDVLMTWSNSAGHFRNMTSAKYKRVGVGFHEGTAGQGRKRYYWVQVFSGAN